MVVGMRKNRVPHTQFQLTEGALAMEWHLACHHHYISGISSHHGTTTASQGHQPHHSIEEITHIVSATKQSMGGTNPQTGMGKPDKQQHKEPINKLQAAMGKIGMRMILRASEKFDIDEVDAENNDIGGMERTTPLDTLTALLEAASAAHASNLLNAMM